MCVYVPGVEGGGWVKGGKARVQKLLTRMQRIVPTATLAVLGNLRVENACYCCHIGFICTRSRNSQVPYHPAAGQICCCGASGDHGFHLCNPLSDTILAFGRRKGKHALLEIADVE